MNVAQPMGAVVVIKTVWLYHEGLAQADVVDALFKQCDLHLARQGDIARRADAGCRDPVSWAVDHLLMLVNPGADVWADPAYRFEEMVAKPHARGLNSRIHRKHSKPLSERDNVSNLAKSAARARLEHVVSAQTKDMGGTPVRTIGLVRAKAKIGMKTLAYNMRSLAQLRRLNSRPA